MKTETTEKTREQLPEPRITGTSWQDVCSLAHFFKIQAPVQEQGQKQEKKTSS